MKKRPRVLAIDHFRELLHYVRVAQGVLPVRPNKRPKLNPHTAWDRSPE